MRIAAVEHGNLPALQTRRHQLAHFIDHPLRLGKVAGGLEHAHRLTRSLTGAQVLAQALAVMRYELVGRVQDVAAAAVIFFQLDLMAHLELTHKVSHIANARTAKSVDALVIVAHRHDAATRLEAGFVVHRAGRTGSREHLDPCVLQLVGVLKLVNQDMPKTPLIVLADRIVIA